MGPKTLLRRYFAGRGHHKAIHRFGWLGDRLHDPSLWHFGRRSVAGGVGLGFFLAFIPIPIQMFIAVPASIWLRVNLPITMLSLWISNPLTIVPMFVFAFKVGAMLTGHSTDVASLAFDPSIAGFTDKIGEVWWPLSVGCFVCGLSAAAIGNLAVRWLWYRHLMDLRRKKTNRYANKQ